MIIKIFTLLFSYITSPILTIMILHYVYPNWSDVYREFIEMYFSSFSLYFGTLLLSFCSIAVFCFSFLLCYYWYRKPSTKLFLPLFFINGILTSYYGGFFICGIPYIFLIISNKLVSIL